MPHREYFTETLTERGATGATVTLRGRRAGAGTELHYLSVTVENRTSGTNVVRVGREVAGTLFPRAGFPSFAANAPQNYSTAEIVIRNQDRLRVDWSGSTDGDQLVVVAEGYVWKLDLAPRPA